MDGLIAAADDDEVAVVDAFVDHRVADDAQDVVVVDGTVQQLRRHRQALVAGQRFDGASGGDEAEERELRRDRLFAGRQAQAALLVLLAGEVTLLAQQSQVLVDGAVRGVAEAVADLAVRRRVAVTALELGEEVEDGLLAFGERCAHGLTSIGGRKA